MTTWLIFWLVRRISQLEDEVDDLEDRIKYDYTPVRED